jgi:DnaJ-class molecular chaperone
MPGDVVFEIEQKPHPRFQRKNDDLFYQAEIDLLTALAGGTIHIEHLDERWLTVNIAPGEVIVPGKFCFAPNPRILLPLTRIRHHPPLPHSLAN